MKETKKKIRRASIAIASASGLIFLGCIYLYGEMYGRGEVIEFAIRAGEKGLVYTNYVTNKRVKIIADIIE